MSESSLYGTFSRMHASECNGNGFGPRWISLLPPLYHPRLDTLGNRIGSWTGRIGRQFTTQCDGISADGFCLSRFT